ncbi:amino acid permease/ SLC12A domain-containing protein [Aspergillus novoparasiticus]|uniref:Amino acid permease/ SLC12A domain-containing protein n=1 Tax=Aspergillus novoparasiticus TaxID=986946 RepID=A0A5N6FBZ4_9EURO|nr:amino acid permease/ SLC12A domain-containing protein [Aspergillus novoparasiticus]
MASFEQEAKDGNDAKNPTSNTPDAMAGDVEEANGNTLKRALEGRHIQMIAMGGAIGAGLFVGSGEALANGGPASVLIGYLIVGVLLLCTIMSLGELAIMYPINGAFYQYSTRFIDPCWGFAIGWAYSLGWLVTLPFEITAASLTIEYWNSDLNPAIFVSIFLIVLVIIQVFGVRGYGEVEFVLSIIKVIACIGLIILGIIINTGGVPGSPQGYIGGKYWRDPGAFANGFKGFCAVFVNAAVAFSGTELVGLAAAETKQPQKTLPTATKQVLWRVTIFYIVNLLIVGLNVPYNSPQLLGSGDAASSAGVSANASPFVLAIQDAGIHVLPSIINAVVLISSLSVANSSTFASTRTLQALAADGGAPSFFAYIDKAGRPLAPIALQVLFGFLAYLQFASSGLTIFNWLLSIAGVSTVMMNLSINMAHIRFRLALKAQNRSTDEIPWKSTLGTVGSSIGAFLSAIALVAMFYSALYAPGGDPPSAFNFFQQYLAGFMGLILMIFWKIWNRQWWLGVPLRQIDLDTGRRFMEMEPVTPDGTGESLPWWKRAKQTIC